jgi:hypothetical protein
MKLTYLCLELFRRRVKLAVFCRQLLLKLLKTVNQFKRCVVRSRGRCFQPVFRTVGSTWSLDEMLSHGFMERWVSVAKGLCISQAARQQYLCLRQQFLPIQRFANPTSPALNSNHELRGCVFHADNSFNLSRRLRVRFQSHFYYFQHD